MNYKIEKIGKLRRYKPMYDLNEKVSVGSSVKLIFKPLDKSNPAINAERLWITVTKVNDKGAYRGTIDNDPQYINLKYGDEVNFTKQNIFDIDNS